MYKLSIVVPVYNVETYIRRCLDSLINQVYKNIEIVVVNDGSTDGSQKIIDEYCIAYPRLIKSLYKQNGGLSSARNFGLECVTGDYLCFVDSDDWVDFNLYNIMMNHIINSDSDIVCCNFIEHYNDKNVTRHLNNKDKYHNNMVAWNKVIKTSFWQNNLFRFKEKILHEDNELIPRVLLSTNKVSFVECVFYNYERRNINSITKGSILHLHYFPTILHSLDSYYKKTTVTDMQYELFCSEMLYIYIFDNNYSSDIESVFHQYKHYLRSELPISKKRQFFISLININLQFGMWLNKCFKKLLK